MREIVSIQCGQAGNQVGSAFWETIMQEHGLDAEGRAVSSNAMNDRLDVFFQESSTRKYVPRAIAIDLEPATLDNIRNGSLGGVFRPDNMIGGQSGAGNNWAKGFYTEGAELREPAMDAIRRETEVADSLQGFQVTHSLGGGTGSGMGTLLLTAIREEFNDRMLSTYSILPSPQASETVTEPYNAMMALHHLIDSSNLTHCLDNEALYNICTRTLKINQPTHQDLNKLIAMVMSGTTTGLRYPGQLNGDLRKMAVNLVPFTRMHFFSTAFAPLVAPNTRAFHNLSVPELTQQLFNSSNTMVACDQNAGKYLAVSTTFRGKVATKEVEDCIQAAYDKRRDLFVDWIPNNFLTSVCSAPPVGFDTSATLVANTTATMELLRRTEQQFHQMFERKAFLHWYTSEGMEESEFGEASSNVYDLFSEYEQAHNWTQSDTIEGVDESMIPDEEDVMEE